MYILINTFNAIPGDTVGTVISIHRSREGAERADVILQHRIRANNSPNSYLPTMVAEKAPGPALFKNSGVREEDILPG
jgi:D-arabinose 5-phosphate isomerase GutQ